MTNLPLSVHHAFSAAICSCSSRSYAMVFLFDRLEAPAPHRFDCIVQIEPRLLGGLAQRFERQVARSGFIVADDHRKTRAARVGLFHLRLETAAAAVKHDSETRIAQTLR